MRLIIAAIQIALYTGQLEYYLTKQWRYNSIPFGVDFKYNKYGKIHWASAVSALWSFLWEYIRGTLASIVYYLTIAKYTWENYRGTLKTAKI